jgi:hypothetical protein
MDRVRQLLRPTRRPTLRLLTAARRAALLLRRQRD